MIFDTARKLFRGSANALTCTVITPVGPGHEGLYRDCKASVEKAWHYNHGPFSGISHIAIDDTQGQYGRSRARNIGIRRAAEHGADWLFFLDADDLLVQGAFEDFLPYAADHDAVWGLIVGESPGASEVHLRMPQILSLNSFDELILFDPFLTLQMGHFVRTQVAQEVQFNESMNVGEDVDYYLRVWKNHRCSKVQKTFFINRHSRRSIGPKAATGEEWGAVVRSRLLEERGHHALLAPSARMLELKNARVAEVQRFCRQQQFAGYDDYLSLSRQMPYRGYFDVTSYEGENFVVYTNNDDRVCASLAWTGEYRPLSCGLWQVLAKSAQTIFDIGAEHGFFGLLAARAAVDSQIHCFETACEKFARMRLNIDLNGCTNMHALHGNAEGEPAALHAMGMTPAHAGDASPPPIPQSMNVVHVDAYVERNRIDRVDLARVDVEGSALAVIKGMRENIAKSHPDILIEVADGYGEAQLSVLLKDQGYRFYAIYDSRREIAATADLLAGGGDQDLYRLASVRETDEVAQLAQEAYGRPVNFG
jgi:FkbM family methyltransferase